MTTMTATSIRFFFAWHALEKHLQKTLMLRSNENEDDIDRTLHSNTQFHRLLILVPILAAEGPSCQKAMESLFHKKLGPYFYARKSLIVLHTVLQVPWIFSYASSSTLHPRQ